MSSSDSGARSCLEYVESVIQNNGLENVQNIIWSDGGLKDIYGFDKLVFLNQLDLSKNAISDLSPLSGLTQLQCLDLSYNNISSIMPLSNLTLLHTLIISGNTIKSVEDFLPLQSMVNLEELIASGNPVCSDVRYPKDVFAMQANVHKVDDYFRREFSNDYVYTEEDPRSYDSEMAVDRIRSLNAQIESMKSAFEVLERETARNGQEVARTVATAIVSDADIDSGDQIDELVGEFPYYRVLQSWRVQAVQSLVAKEIAERQLLQHIEATKADQAEQRAKRERTEALYIAEKKLKETLLAENENRRRLEASRANQMVEVRAENLAATAQLDKLKRTLDTLRRALPRLQEGMNASCLQSELQLKNKLDRMAAHEAKMRELADKVRFATIAMELKQIQLRNDAAALEAERIQFQQMVRRDVDQKARDKAAAAGRQFRSKQSHHSGEEEVVDVTDESEPASESEWAPEMDEFVSADLAPSAEAEGVLRHLFGQLGGDERGTILVTDFLSNVLKHYIPTPELFTFDMVQLYLLDVLCETELTALLQGGDFFRPLGVELFQLLGDTLFVRFLLNLLSRPVEAAVARGGSHYVGDDCSPADGRGSEITFGELLLQLFPRVSKSSRAFSTQVRYIQNRILPRVVTADGRPVVNSSAAARRLLDSGDTRSALSPQDIHSLKQAGLLGDARFGVVPLCIPSASTVEQVTSDGGRRGEFKTLNSTAQSTIIPPPTISELQGANRRLEQEKHFLLHAIQDMTRSLEGRAQGIRQYFADDLKKSALKTDRLRTKVETLTNDLETANRRLQQSERVHREHFDETSAQLHALRTKVIELEAEGEKRTTDLVREYRAQVAALETKTTTQEEQLRILNTDIHRRDTKLKSLERSRIESEKTSRDHCKQIEELKRRVTALTAEKTDEAALWSDRIRNCEAEWAREKAELLERLAQSQESVNKLHAIAAVEAAEKAQLESDLLKAGTSAGPSISTEEQLQPQSPQASVLPQPMVDGSNLSGGRAPAPQFHFHGTASAAEIGDLQFAPPPHLGHSQHQQQFAPHPSQPYGPFHGAVLHSRRDVQEGWDVVQATRTMLETGISRPDSLLEQLSRLRQIHL